MLFDRDEQASATRRMIVASLLGTAILASQATKAETSSSVDTAPHQFALNLSYLVTNYLRGGIYADGTLTGSDIRGGELVTPAGIRVTTTRQVRFDSSTYDLEARLREMADISLGRVRYLRGILRGETPQQTLIDLSPTTFTTMFRLAGAIGPSDTFDPYASALNFMLGAASLMDVYAGAITAMFPLIANDLAQPSYAGLIAATSLDASTVRSMVYRRAQTLNRPDLVETVNRLAQWRARVGGSTTTDRSLSPNVSGGSTVSTIATVDGDGLMLTRTPQQALNVLFMSSAAVRQGGFFPNGIVGIIGTSAAN